MRAIVLLLVTLCTASPGWPSTADEASFEILRDTIRANKKGLVAASLTLTDAESDAFWPVYDRYEAGLNKDLMAAAQYLSDARAGHWQTCVNPEYVNLNKRRMSPTGLRIVTMLTGKAALQLPRVYTGPQYKLPKDTEFRRKFVSVNRVRYYLQQPKVSPWRVWHFRMGWLQERITGEPAEDTGAGWKLFVCDGASMPVQVALPKEPVYPTRVPGF